VEIGMALMFCIGVVVVLFLNPTAVAPWYWRIHEAVDAPPAINRNFVVLLHAEGQHCPRGRAGGTQRAGDVPMRTWIPWTPVIAFGVFAVVTIHSRNQLTNPPTEAGVRVTVSRAGGEQAASVTVTRPDGTADGAYGLCADHHRPVITLIPEGQSSTRLRVGQTDCSPGREWLHSPMQFAPCPDGRLPRIRRSHEPGATNYDVNCSPDRQPAQAQPRDDEIES
jgi:hypothetical protein